MSQPEEITLAVDVDGDGANPAVSEVFSNFERPANRSIYHSIAHTPILRDTMTLYRTAPKPTVSFYGVLKCAVKFSMDAMVDTPDGATTRAPGIIELSGSFPVGFSDADRLHLMERVKAFIYNRTACNKLFGKGEV